MNRRDFLASTAAGTAASLARQTLGDEHHHHATVPEHNKLIHSSGTHHFRAQVRNGKVSGVNAIHKQTGRVEGHHKKVRSRKRMQELISTDAVNHVVFGGQETASVVQPAYIYVGYYFMFFGTVYIFWWPVALVDGGDSGAVDYP